MQWWCHRFARNAHGFGPSRWCCLCSLWVIVSDTHYFCSQHISERPPLSNYRMPSSSSLEAKWWQILIFTSDKSEPDARLETSAPITPVHNVWVKLVNMTLPPSLSLQALNLRGPHLGHHCRSRVVTEMQSHSRWKPIDYVTQWIGCKANQNVGVVSHFDEVDVDSVHVKSKVWYLQRLFVLKRLVILKIKGQCTARLPSSKKYFSHTAAKGVRYFRALLTNLTYDFGLPDVNI